MDPEFADLKGKTVAVVCRPTQSVQYSKPLRLPRIGLRKSPALLKTNVKKIKIIDQQKVNDCGGHKNDPEAEYALIGKDLKG